MTPTDLLEAIRSDTQAAFSTYLHPVPATPFARGFLLVPAEVTTDTGLRLSVDAMLPRDIYATICAATKSALRALPHDNVFPLFDIVGEIDGHRSIFYVTGLSGPDLIKVDKDGQQKLGLLWALRDQDPDLAGRLDPPGSSQAPSAAGEPGEAHDPDGATP